MNTTPPARPGLRPVEAKPGVTVHPGSDRRLATEHWLLSAHPSRKQARAEWRTLGVATLRLGTLFSAVRIPGRLVQAITASTDPLVIDKALAEVLSGGPVICDVYGPRYYALVPASVPRTWQRAADDWRSQEVECLGAGAYLGVPRLDAVSYPPVGARAYWSVPMESMASLCEPLAVARLIAAGLHGLDDDRAPWPADAPLTPRR